LAGETVMNAINESVSLLSIGADGWGDDLLRGAARTLELGALSLLFGIAFGLILAGGKLSRSPFLRIPASGYTLFIRGVPEFLVLLLVYFGSEQIINQSAISMGLNGDFAVSRFAAAVAGLSLIFAAYACDVFRGAYLSVPKGQMEAAIAVGMSPTKAFIRVRLPQLWRFAIPGLGNLWMVMLKDTSLAAVLAVDELLRVAKLAGETTRLPLLFLCTAGLLYLAMTALSDLIRARIEARSRRGLPES